VAERVRARARALVSRCWYQFCRVILTGSCRLVWGVEVIGAERVPRSGAFVLAPVHRSFIDTFLCGCLTRRRLRFIGKDTMWKYRLSGPVMDSLGGIPVHRGTPDREALKACEAAVRAGEPVVLFPEGTRRDGPKLHPLFEGAAFVAARTGVPIVPVGIGGSEWALPKGARMIGRSRIVMVVGDPIDPPRPAEGAARVSRRAVGETTDLLAERIQALFDDALERAGRTGQPSPGTPSDG
jgi:1-acyl-sn-glycerol-3-phosphate acyltransferase